MRFCVSGRHQYSTLKKADEIKVEYRDREKILDFVEKIPEKTIILDLPNLDAPDWQLWQMYTEKFKEFYIALHDLSYYNSFNENNIKWYWPYPITTYYELQMVVALHPSYLLIGAPLTFDLNKIIPITYDIEKNWHIPLRMVANVAHSKYLPEYTYGICGQWVRPEDCDEYGKRVRCLEFDEVTLDKESVLLQVYKYDKTWPGNLNFIIEKLHFNIDNRTIPEDLCERRMLCGNTCWAGSGCRLCSTSFKFGEQIRKTNLARKRTNKE